MQSANPPLPPQETGQQPAQADNQVIAKLSAILATGLTIDVTGNLVIGVLVGAAGLPLAAATAAWKLMSLSLKPPGEVGPAGKYVDRMEWNYRAAYLLNASRRIASSLKTGNLSDAIKAEKGYFRAHVQASQNRKEVGQTLDATVKQQGGRTTLKWKAVLDSVTSKECRAMNGKHFDVARPPLIGLPGSVHPSCRCIGVPVTSPDRARQLVAA